MKKDYTVYFEIYGKKLKVIILAESESEARQLVKDKIIFHKIEKTKSAFNECVNSMEDILNILNK